MRGFIVRRMVQAVVTLLLMTLVVHLAVTFLPGDPIRALFGFRRPDPEVYEALRSQFNFDKPWVVQYALYLRDLLTGDWGYTYPGAVRAHANVGPPVSSVIAASLPATLRILVPVLIIQVAAGITAGIASVTRPARSATAIYVLCVLLLGLPVIALAYALQASFGSHLGWLPVQGVRQGWAGYVLPTVSLTLTATAFVALLTRSQLKEVLKQPFIRAARARAVPERRIVSIHALRHAVVPVISFVIASFGQLFTGLIVVEGIFNIGGVGGLVYNSIRSRDRVLLLTMLVLVTAVVIIASLIADIVHTMADPRVRREEAT